MNGCELLAWAKAEGFRERLPIAALHVTVLLSREPVDWAKLGPCEAQLSVREGNGRCIRDFGGVVVLLFTSRRLIRRHEQFRKIGAVSEYPAYRPHVTFALKDRRDLSEVRPYRGPLLFGPECFKEPFDDWQPVNPRRRDTSF